MADSIIVKANLFALAASNDDDYSLAELGRAIAHAPRRDNVPVWRAFIRTRGNQFVRETRTQRIRIKYSAARTAAALGTR